MGAITSMIIDYGDCVYKYTPQGYSVEVREGKRLLAGGPRVNMYGLEDFRLDLCHWELEKKEVSENGEWQTLYFRKRRPVDLVVIKEQSDETTYVSSAIGYEVVDGKYYIFSSGCDTEVVDSAEWNVKKTRFSYPGYSKNALIFTLKKAS